MRRTPRRFRWLLPFVLFGAAASASAQDTHSMALTLLGGVGGSDDAEPGAGYGNQTYQLGFAIVTEAQTAVAAKLGRIDLDDEALGGWSAATVDYAQIGGEYRFHEGWYESGIYLGLGGYRLRGDRAGGEDSETALGGELALLGDFAFTRALALRVEIGGHYVLFDDARLFATGLAGLAIRF